MSASGVEGKNGHAPQLLLAHVARLDPETPTARERLELVLGSALARRLVFALSRRPAA